MTDKPVDLTAASNVLVASLAGKIRVSLAPDGQSPAAILEWLATQDADTIKASLIRTQPKAWATAIVPFVDSLTPDQRIGALAAFIAVWVQAQ